MSIFGLLIIVGIVILACAKLRKKPEIPSGGGEIYLPPDGPGDSPEPPVDLSVVKIYQHEPVIRGWCCPNCQCENDHSNSYCCVCNYKK